MKRSCLACLCLILLSISSPIQAEVRQTTRWHDAVIQLVDPQGPGVVVLIANGDKVIHHEAAGMANIELAVPMKPDDAFRIASITKMFTAAAVIKLAERHRLGLDDTLAAYLPDFPGAAKITLHQLLNHTAGISDTVHDPQPGFSQTEASTAAMVSQISRRTPEFAPGAKWAYSNAGYVLLGAVIEEVTGQRWYEALQSEFFEPLHLSDTYYGTADNLIYRRAAGYSVDSVTHTVTNARAISSSIPAAAGGLVSTAQDLFLWMRALTHEQAISGQGFEKMITPVSQVPGEHNGSDYGMGMSLWQVRGRTMIGHTGQIAGFASALGYLSDLDVTIVVLANSENFDARNAARRLAAIALGQPYETAPAATLSTAQLTALTGIFQAENGTVRILSLKDGRLYSQRGQGNAIPMEFGTDGQLRFVPDEISCMTPVWNNGNLIGLDYFANGDGPAQRYSRISEPEKN